jgi:hypothetical protein
VGSREHKRFLGRVKESFRVFGAILGRYGRPRV